MRSAKVSSLRSLTRRDSPRRVPFINQRAAQITDVQKHVPPSWVGRSSISASHARCRATRFSGIVVRSEARRCPGGANFHEASHLREATRWQAGVNPAMHSPRVGSSMEAIMHAGSPAAVPIMHCILVHSSSHEVVVAQLPGQSELLIGLEFPRPPHIGSVVRHIRLHVEVLASPCDQRKLVCRK